MAAEERLVVLLLHPRTRAALTRKNMLEKGSQRIQLIGPVGYKDILMLEKRPA